MLRSCVTLFVICLLSGRSPPPPPPLGLSVRLPNPESLCHSSACKVTHVSTTITSISSVSSSHKLVCKRTKVCSSDLHSYTTPTHNAHSLDQCRWAMPARATRPGTWAPPWSCRRTTHVPASLLHNPPSTLPPTSPSPPSSSKPPAASASTNTRPRKSTSCSPWVPTPSLLSDQTGCVSPSPPLHRHPCLNASPASSPPRPRQQHQAAKTPPSPPPLPYPYPLHPQPHFSSSNINNYNHHHHCSGGCVAVSVNVKFRPKLFYMSIWPPAS